MQKPFQELRERLLRGGVAPRHVRRYLNELADHLADLTKEEERAGRSTSDAEAAAIVRLGTVEHLAKAMLERRRFRSWCARAPWAMFSVTPLVFLLAAYLVSALILWSGWLMFIPAADTPFGQTPPRISSLGNIYFQIGRMIYFTAPVVIGLAIGLVAVRQRLRTVWPVIGIALVAWMGGTAQIHASRSAVPHGPYIALSFFVSPPDQTLTQTLLHIVVYFALIATTYLILRMRSVHSLAQ
ncbi:MAG TPA: hypothetical protein VFA85_02975 [Terriglobales bacterium]|nr:hypothetical protein [Terriglobales bacterium]